MFTYFSAGFHSFLLVCILVVLSFEESEASHALGAELTYECLGNDLYRIRLAFYYDCNGTVGPPESPDIEIASSCFNTTIELELLPPPIIQPPFDQYLTPYEVPVYCEASSCGSGSLPGIKEFIYVDTLELPACDDYFLSFSLSNRSGAIQTIYPSDIEIYVEAFLNSVEAPCNSSPQFDLPARGFICVDQDNLMVHTATDFDGDQIVYSLYAPLITATTAVSYIPPYTYLDPIGNNYLNMVDGLIDIWPTEQTVSLLGIKVEEYRNGVLIGSVMRDMQVSVLANCPQNPVGLFEHDGFSGADLDSIFICTADTFFLDVYLDSTLVGNNYTLQANNLSDFPGAVFYVESDSANPGSVIGHFSWSPDFQNVITQTLVFSAYDDNCPIVSYRNFTFTFHFRNLFLDATTEHVGVACNDSTLLEVILDEAVPPIVYLWQDATTEDAIWAEPGIYYVNVTDSLGCNSTDTFVVYLNNYPVADFTVSDVCLNQTMVINDLSTNYADVGITPLMLTDWNWDFGDDMGISVETEPTYTYSAPGNYDITLVIENENGCSDIFQYGVVVYPIPELDVTSNTACFGTVTQFVNNSQILAGQIVSWNWDFSDLGATSSEIAPEQTFSEIGSFQVELSATSDLGCETDTVIEVVVVEEALAAFSYVIEPDCEIENLRVYCTNQSERATAFLWDFGTYTDTITDPVYDTPDGSGPFITLIAYAEQGVAACSDTVMIDVTDMWLAIDFDSIPAGNVITPNEDGFNDCLAPFYHKAYQECYRLRIWDRWGRHVYDSDNEGPDGYCWYGTKQNGNRVSNGTFYFVAEVNAYVRAGYVIVTE